MPATELQQYFDAERQAGLLAAGLGLASFTFAAYLWMTGSPFKAMVWPLIVFGTIELGVGVGLAVRTPPQLRALDVRFAAAPRDAAASELQRMTRVNRSFRIIKAGEVVLLAIGVALAMFLPASSLAWRAVGMGLLLQSAVLLVFDIVAEHRAHVYAQWLATIGA